MGLFEGGFGVIRGEVWVNALQGTLACCTACASATVYHIYPRPPRAGLPEALLVAIVAAMDMVRGRGLALALRVCGLALALAAALALALLAGASSLGPLLAGAGGGDGLVRAAVRRLLRAPSARRPALERRAQGVEVDVPPLPLHHVHVLAQQLVPPFRARARPSVFGDASLASSSCMT